MTALDQLPTTLTCRMCGDTKPLDQFVKQPNCKNGRRPRCKRCHAAKERQWRLDNPEESLRRERARDRTKDYEKGLEWKRRYYASPKGRIALLRGHLKHQYGMTLEEFRAMADRQEQRCLLCKQKPSRLVVDHCHSTGRIRGLLCDKCNTGLGFFGDDVEQFRRAIEYLSHR